MQEVFFAIRGEMRDDVRAMAQVRAALIPAGLVPDLTREPTCERNGGLWQYRVPVAAKITA